VSLTTGDRQKISTRLAPAIGEQEAEMLLDQFPSNADAELVTVGRLAETDHRIDMLDAKIDMVEMRLDAKIDMVEARLDAKIELLRRDMKTGFERLEKIINARMRTQTILMFTTIVAVLGIAARTNIFG
jgi:glycosyltransferase A (GT-A) superfamily protein (DUF2064 family)